MVTSLYLNTQVLDEGAFEAARALLSAGERERHDRFVFERDRRDFAFAHSLARTTLSTYAGCPANAWTFALAEHGKPFIASPVTRALSFNISHALGFVACAVAPGIDVGIDVETLERRVDVDELARRCFAGIEIEGLHALTGTDRTARFFELWTLKEAYIKAVGVGLSHALDAMSFVFMGTGEIVFTPPPGIDAGDWRFALYAPTPQHRMAVAVRCDGQPCEISAVNAATGLPATAVAVSVR